MTELVERNVGFWKPYRRRFHNVNYITGKDEYGVEHTVQDVHDCEIDIPQCPFCLSISNDASSGFCCRCGARLEWEK